jgi:hypothetical protein
LSSVVIAGIVFICTFGGGMLGMSLRTVLPESHLNADSKEVVRITSGLLATLAALVLGLLVASAKSGFDAQENGFQQLAANVVVLDRLLARGGPEANPAREALRRTVSRTIDSLWPATGSASSGLDAADITSESDSFFAAIRDLGADNDPQRIIQTQAVQLGAEMARTRWLLSQEQDSASSIPFLAVLSFWLFALFVSFGLFAPRNGAVMTAIIVCALSAAGAVFLIVDLNRPSGGLIQVSDAPFRYALSQLGK